MDGLYFRILNGQVEGYMCELKRRPVRRGECEVPARLRLYGAEDISRAAAFVFAIPPGFAPRLGWKGRADIGVQRSLQTMAMMRCLWLSSSSAAAPGRSFS